MTLRQMPLYENVTGRMIFYWFSYIGVSTSFFSHGYLSTRSVMNDALTV